MFQGTFFLIFWQNCLNLAFRKPVEGLPSTPYFSRVFLRFSNFLRSSLFSPSATREETTTFFGDNNLAPIHLKRKREGKMC